MELPVAACRTSAPPNERMDPASCDASRRSWASARGPVPARTVVAPRTLARTALAEPLTVWAEAVAGHARRPAATRATTARTRNRLFVQIILTSRFPDTFELLPVFLNHSCGDVDRLECPPSPASCDASPSSCRRRYAGPARPTIWSIPQ